MWWVILPAAIAQLPLKSVGLPQRSQRGVGFGDLTWHSWPTHACKLSIDARVSEVVAATTVKEMLPCLGALDSDHQFSHKLFKLRSEQGDCETASGPWAPWIHPAFHVCYALAAANLTNMHENDVVLDLGSGCGFKLQMWSEWLGIRGMGIDYAARHVDYANNLFAQNNAPIHSCVGTVTDLTWIPNRSIDVVHAHAVFMYLKQSPKATCSTIHEIYHILKPGGIMIIMWQFRYFTIVHLRKCMHGERVLISILDETDIMTHGHPDKKILMMRKST